MTLVTKELTYGEHVLKLETGEIARQASGAVMFGFLGGLAVGAPVAGRIIDATGSYQPVWIGALVLAGISALVARYAEKSAGSTATSGGVD